MFTLRSLMLWMALAAFVVTVGDTQASNNLSLAVSGSNQNIAPGQSIELAAANKKGFYPGSLVVLPEDGREMYFQALDKARRNIRIEICVLEDPLILEHLKQAITRGVNVRVIVDQGKYQDLVSEQANLFSFVTEVGGQLHLSNPIFPRSFPKIILIDSRYAIVGSACLDTTTFLQYRDYAYVTGNSAIIKDLARLFENDWQFSSPPGQVAPDFNPTPRISKSNLIVSPVNAAERLVSFIQKARETLDLTSELLGNPTLESELAAAVSRGVAVRLISPVSVNGATVDIDVLQASSMSRLKAAGVDVHVTGPNQSFDLPYMHARSAVVDGKTGYVGSVSLSQDSTTYNREVGLVLRDQRIVRKLKHQFEVDFFSKSQAF